MPIWEGILIGCGIGLFGGAIGAALMFRDWRDRV